ncbi:hypothetical protein [Mesorhizobium sp. KR9-304]|uniref:hypothetical protein n=1 Tax=Mesorhizobium sp. KR9-304 TaxID=3156614 RepID=UPI0032B609AD
MFVIWTGQGLLIALAAIFGTIVGYTTYDLSSRFVFSLPEQFSYFFVCLGAAIGCYLVALYLEQKSRGRVVIDKKTGREFTLRRSHKLFYISARRWSYMLLAASALALIYGLISLFAGDQGMTNPLP